jgi:hypothetical protein
MAAEITPSAKHLIVHAERVVNIDPIQDRRHITARGATRPEWFQFERDVRLLMSTLGRSATLTATDCAPPTSTWGAPEEMSS